MSTAPDSPTEIFCSYAPQDEEHLRTLETFLIQLQREKLITLWHHRKLAPGIDWTQEIDKRYAEELCLVPACNGAT